nr:hypothetical protein [Clostridia bacterium]
MAKDYEGKLGIGQIIFCIIAAATLCIPFIIDPMEFSYDHILPIAESDINFWQDGYIHVLFETVGIADKIPQVIYDIIPYAFVAFYGILAFDIVFALLMMIIRNEVMRVLVRTISVLLGFVMLAVNVVMLATVAGVFANYFKYVSDTGTPIFDYLKNSGVIFFAGVMIFSLIAMVKQFSSFFGKTR